MHHVSGGKKREKEEQVSKSYKEIILRDYNRRDYTIVLFPFVPQERDSSVSTSGHGHLTHFISES